MDKVPTDRFPWDGPSEAVVTAAGKLDPADQSREATYLREVAESVVEHRQAQGWRPAGLDVWQRRAVDGETCTCGRKAIKIYWTLDAHEIGYCGIPDGGAR